MNRGTRPDVIWSISQVASCLMGVGIACGVGCATTPTDRFVDVVAKPTFVQTTDGRLEIPLSTKLTFVPKATSDRATLLSLKSDDGPTYIVVVDLNVALSLASCAQRHQSQIAEAMRLGGVEITAPTVRNERRRDQDVPRLSYATPLEAHSGARPASLLSAWTYRLTGGRCVGLGVTSLVRASRLKETEPDPDELRRHEETFELVADATRETRKD